MKKLITMAVATTALLGAAPGSAVAAKEPFAQVISHVKLDTDGTATVRARYMCESSTHLWVSAKQTADGSVDPALEAGMAWVQWCIVEEAENGEFVSDQRWVRVK